MPGDWFAAGLCAGAVLGVVVGVLVGYFAGRDSSTTHERADIGPALRRSR